MDTTTLTLIPVELTQAVESTALAAEGRTTLRDAFAPHFIEFHKLADTAKSIAVNDPEGARKNRLALKAVRVACEKTRKALKDDILVRGRAIDSINAVLETQITPIETQLDNIEKAEERAAAQRKAELKLAREAQLAPYGLNTNFYPLADMTEEVFAQLLADTKLASETRAEQARVAEEKRIAAEKQAESDRIEAARVAAEKAEAQRVENERLKKEAAEREAAAKIERERVAAERAELQRKADEAAAAARKEREELEARLAAERAERERVEAEKRAQEKAEADRLEAERVAAAAAKAADEEKARKAAAAPDREKLGAWVNSLRALHLPEMNTGDADTLANEIDRRRIDVADWAHNQIQNL